MTLESVREGATSTPHTPPWQLLLDTHVLLELWLFQQPALVGLGEALAKQKLVWCASQPMLDELAYVRSRPWEPRWTPRPELFAPEPLCTLLAPPDNPAPWRCRDPDDQKFLDLAYAHRSLRLWSRDRALLHWRKRAAALGITIETPEAGWAAWQATHS